MATDFFVDFPLKEVLMALRGFTGDIFTERHDDSGFEDHSVNQSIQFSKQIFADQFHPCDVMTCQKILHVASEYMKTRKFCQKYQICKSTCC